MPRRTAKAAQRPDLALITQDGNQCGSCHEKIRPFGGVCFGRPGFIVPAINVCRKCIETGLTIISPDDFSTRKGTC